MPKTRFIHSTKPSKYKLLVIIIASRIEYRKKSRGPVSLLKINNESLINKQIKILKEFGDIVVSLGYQIDKIIQEIPEEIKIVENIQFESTNDIEDIRLCINNNRGYNLLIVDGRIIPSRKSLSKINFDESSIIVNKEIDGIGILEQNGIVKNFQFDNSFLYKWTGITYLTGKELIKFKQLCNRENNKKLIYELLTKIITDGELKIIIDNEIKKI